MLIKTRELTGRALDWSVAYAIGVPLDFGLTDDERFSTDWAQAGPLIEQEKIDLYYSTEKSLWAAAIWKDVQGGGSWGTNIPTVSPH